MKKTYELLKEPSKPFYRIRALIDIPHWGVKAGDLGGLVENEECLSQDGTSWIDETSQVEKNVRIQRWVYVGEKTCIGGKVTIESTRIYDSSIDMDGILNCTMIRNSKLYDAIEIIRDITVEDSELRNSTFYGNGTIKGSRLKGVAIEGLITIEASKVIAKEKLTVDGTTDWKDADVLIEMGSIGGKSVMHNVTLHVESLRAYNSFNLTRVVTKGDLKKIRLLDSPDYPDFIIEIIGEEESPITIKGKSLGVQASTIKGNVRLHGDLFVQDSDIRDYVSISMDGTIEKCSFSEMASVNQPMGSKQALMNLKLSGEDVYTPPF